MDIIDALNDENVFAPLVKGSSWGPWRAFLAALFGLNMTPGQLAIYRECTGRTSAPTQQATTAYLCCGRRAGKSFTLALVACFLACFKDWKPCLGPGERGVVMVIAQDRQQAKVILRYIVGLIKGVPMLAQLLQAERAEGLDLNNRISVQVHASSYRSVRGFSCVAVLADELAFWPTSEDSANPDSEVLNALKPAMATVPGSMLLCASSPYARKGVLWREHQNHFGKDGDPVLYWQASTRRMNPSVPQALIDEAMEADPAHAAAEYGAQFRTDVESFVSIEAVQACISEGVFERAPEPNTLYFGFVDPSGGSADSMTLAIGHGDGDTAVLDALREVRPPFSPESVVSEFCDLLRRYNIVGVSGDRYAGMWPREQFAKRGVEYWPSALNKSQLYINLLPSINSATVDLLDHPKMVSQLVSLERRTSRGSRDSIDHPQGGRDDIANALAGLVSLLSQPEEVVSLCGPVLFHEDGTMTGELPKFMQDRPSRVVDLTEEFGGPFSRRPG